MESICGFILKVQNLNRCKTFYRDVLRLGNPITDSNFRTEFRLTDSAKLVLCQAREEEEIQKSVRSAIWFFPENPEEQTELLDAYGYQPVPDELNLLYPNVKCYHDPENNPVYLVTGK